MSTLQGYCENQEKKYFVCEAFGAKPGSQEKLDKLRLGLTQFSLQQWTEHPTYAGGAVTTQASLP